MIELQPLFKVKTVSNYRDETREIVARQELIDSMRRYNFYKEVEILGNYDYNLPEFIEITQDVKSGRSYSRIDYKVTTNRELTDQDMIALRALDVFMVGQRFGELVSVKQENNNFIHHVVSECDRGD